MNATKQKVNWACKTIAVKCVINLCILQGRPLQNNKVHRVLRGPENADDNYYFYCFGIERRYVLRKFVPPAEAISCTLLREAIPFYLYTHNYTPIVCIFLLLSIEYVKMASWTRGFPAQNHVIILFLFS